MLQTFQILATVLVAFAMAPAIAHALEFPGKMRLSRDAYLTVQPIYSKVQLSAISERAFFRSARADNKTQEMLQRTGKNYATNGSILILQERDSGF